MFKSGADMSRCKLLICSFLMLVEATCLMAQHVHEKPVSGGGLQRPARPQLATGASFAPDGSLWMVGLDAQSNLFVAQSTDLSTWSAPRKLDTQGDAISADGENRPKIAFGPNGQVVISYTRPLEKPYTGWIRMVRSTDGGASFSVPFTVHHDRQIITHRFESIAFDAYGDLHVVWIDKRDLHTAGKAYVGAAVYQVISKDGGATFGPDTKVADHSCECCRISLAQGSDGKLRAMWRHVFGESTRDHAFANLASRVPNQIQRSTFDEWQINACPHHGPGLALAKVDSGDNFHVVWFGLRQERATDVSNVRYGRLDSIGKPILSTVRELPDPKAEHADVASIGQDVAIVWRSYQNQETSLMAWISRDGGKSFSMRVLGKLRGYNDHPRLVANGQRMVVVWRNTEGAQIHEIRF